MITWGIVANSHDASLAVFDNDELLWAGLAKDFSGIPNDPHLNKSLTQHARNEFGEPNRVVWYERPFLKSLRQLRAGQGWLFGENNIKKYLQGYGINVPIEYTQHHHSHAAYAYYTQPRSECAVICLDSIGEFETLTAWHGKGDTLTKIHSQGYPHSLGLFYSAMTQRVGLVPQRDEYMISQWAKEGNADRLFHVILKELVETRGMGYDPFIRMRENLHRGCRWWRPELSSTQDLRDIAAATQAVFEYCVLNLSEWVKKETGAKHLALAGGGALNRDCVEHLRAKWTSVHVPHNPGDPGSCIGAVLAQTQTKIDIDNKWHKVV